MGTKKNRYIEYMKTTSHFKWLILFILVYSNSYSQKSAIIMLDKKVFPLEAYSPLYQQGMQADSASYSKLCNRLRTGDYSDSITQFRITVESPAKEGSNVYTFHISPYESDTVYVGWVSSSSTSVSGNTPVIAAGKRKFRIELVQNGKAAKITEVSNKYLVPDASLYDKKLPDKEFLLLYGGTAQLGSFEHQHKYIYIFIGGLPNKPSLQMLDTLGEVYSMYKNNVTLIDLLSSGAPELWPIDTDAMKKAIAERKEEWVQGFLTMDIAAGLFINGGDYGVLFDEDGNMIKLCMTPTELKAYLKRQEKR